MEPARQRHLKTLRTRLLGQSPWLAGPRAHEFTSAFFRAQKKIRAYRGNGPVVVAEKDAVAYFAGILAAVENNQPVVLANPHWGTGERAQAAAQISPGLWLGANEAKWPINKKKSAFHSRMWAGKILIPTGGTSGRVRWVVHTWGTLAAAARALAKFLNSTGTVHVSTLPPWHVSGLMPAVRALETGGTLWLNNWKTLEAGSAPKLPPENAIVSFVPTQLQRLLARPKVVRWLQKTRAILLGGAAPSPELLAHALKLRLPIALAYGMTETAAVVAAQSPADFLAGEPMFAAALPHAKVWVGDARGRRKLAGGEGRIWIQARSLFLGYYPQARGQKSFSTEDCGVSDENGRVRPMGRLDRVIITGGEKVDPLEVKKRILETGLVRDVQVFGLPDIDWGERVAAVYTGKRKSEKKLRQALKGRLTKFSLPKVWIWAEKLPAGKKLG